MNNERFLDKVGSFSPMVGAEQQKQQQQQQQQRQQPEVLSSSMLSVSSSLSTQQTTTVGYESEDEETEEVWLRCICTNNVGLNQLSHGRLKEARMSFLEASVLYQQASDRRDDDSDGGNSREYECTWISLRSVDHSMATNTSTTSNNELEQVLNPIFLYGLKIGAALIEDDETSHSSSSNEDDVRMTDVVENIDVLRTARIDWAIHYNLGLVDQLLGAISSDMSGMVYRADCFDRYEKLARDIVEWYDGIAPLDAAVLMLALHNNEGCMYRQLKVPHQVDACWNRMRKILNASDPLRSHPLCQVFLQNLELMAREQRLPPAPAA
eukprot:scaffold1027_cov108-Cylindrotheca_fusiformis.AAC.8